MQHTLPKASIYPRASIDMTHSYWTTPHRAVTQPSLGWDFDFRNHRASKHPGYSTQAEGGKQRPEFNLCSGLTPCRQQNTPWARQTIVKNHFKACSELCYPQNGQQCTQGQGRFLWVLIIVDNFPFSIANFQYGSFITPPTLWQCQTHLITFWCV